MLEHYRFRELSRILCFQAPAEPEPRLYDLSYLDGFLIIYSEERVGTGTYLEKHRSNKSRDQQ